MARAKVAVADTKLHVLYNYFIWGSNFRLKTWIECRESVTNETYLILKIKIKML